MSNQHQKLFAAKSNGTQPRLNKLVGKMLENAASSTNKSTINSSSPPPAPTKFNSNFNSNNNNSSTPSSSLLARRNLFGIHLNHEQLKQDLTEMWKEQIEQQKHRWNFDFETLKPLNNVKSTNQAAQCTEERFKWTRINYYVPGLPQQQQNQTYSQASFERSELSSNTSDRDYDDYEDDEEEDDDALAVPQFYKYQRRLKFNVKDNNINNNSHQISAVATTCRSFEPIFKLAMQRKNKTNSTKSTSSADNNDTHSDHEASPTTILKSKPSTKKSSGPKSQQQLRKPKAIKRNNQQSLLALSPSAQKLIITFSENRKDTLRSASQSTKKQPISSRLTTKTISSENSAFVNCTPVSTKSQQNPTKVITTSTNSITTTLKCSINVSAPTTKIFAANTITSKESKKKVKIISPTTSNRSVDTMKQQSLLEIFKQRKRRTNNVFCESESKITKATRSQSLAVTKVTNVESSNEFESEKIRVPNNPNTKNNQQRKSRVEQSSNILLHHNLRSHSSVSAK